MKKLYFFTIIILLTISIMGCHSKKNASILIHNAKIYTVDSLFRVVDCLVIENEKIVFTGSEAEARKKFNTQKEINLNGKFVYPGFIDAHCHFFGCANWRRQADVTGSKSMEEIIDKLRHHQQQFPTAWIGGRGWDQNLFDNKQLPDNSLLEKAFPGKPVVLVRTDGHVVLASNKALELAGILKQKPGKNPEIVYKNGKPTGLLYEKTADLLKNMIPSPDYNEIVKLLLSVQEDCYTYGLTGVVDAGLNIEQIRLLASAQKNGLLNIPMYVMLSNETPTLKWVENTPRQMGRINIFAVKMYADGALGSRGAWLKRPYSDSPKQTGIPVTTEHEMKNICKFALQNNLQVCTHAIGDSAVSFVLYIYSQFLKENNDLRWRIEHSQVVDPNDIFLFGKYKIIPAINTTHATSDMYWAENRLGKNRISNAYAYKQLLEQNGWLCNGSDFPIESINPLLGFYAGIARKDKKGFPENGFQPENKISREQALKAMTIWAAKSVFAEKQTGSLETGKYANIVVLDRDIMQIDEKLIPSTKTLYTFVHGQCVYKAK